FKKTTPEEEDLKRRARKTCPTKKRSPHHSQPRRKPTENDQRDAQDDVWSSDNYTCAYSSA
uniref:Tat protein n=1 Tax=Macrostomum lignano TaxID=282301 RepID=A0A1I8HRP1_9PLAT